ncbi:glucan biosynthesis protein G [Nitrogeniibacter mangrovi]|uniref:Glucan biosynthesis protein G n=2 Tax=Nitrogeniibacter mangrovi TaxID=2016596 RepID=A0A6C1B9Q7_9RHOO|nr:glucan biosynthesis protein G [Nitrogeniibacter mangrovi]
MPRAWRGAVVLVGVLLAGPAALAAPFTFDDVVAQARDRAAKPYSAPREIPEFMQKLSYNEFRSIRFDAEQSLWRDAGARFEVQLIPAGAYYRRPVKINLVDASGAKPLPFRKDYFVSDNDALARRLPANLGFAGFKLTFPLNRRSVREPVLTFAGASYFRGVGKGNVLGLAARGLAIDTGLMSGEEFPQFVEYWLERPARQAEAMRFYALLDSKRVTGAYQFSVYPGAPTRVDVTAVLFVRDRIELFGAAPLTSMFYYGENTARPVGHWRPEVHASDGLLIQNGTGEWLWNPLLNPKALHVQAFGVNGVKGFGLLQRDTRFDSYQDGETRHDRQPSAWLTPRGDWGRGRIMLIEIPSRDAGNDNVVAFWSPPGPVTAGQRFDLDYRISFGGPEVDHNAPARAINTFVGRGEPLNGEGGGRAYRVVVDFAGDALDKLGPDTLPTADVSAQEGGEVIEQFLTYLEDAKRWRLSILARPAEGKPLALRSALSADGKPVTETWTYTLPEPNTIFGDKE